MVNTMAASVDETKFRRSEKEISPSLEPSTYAYGTSVFWSYFYFESMTYKYSCDDGWW